MFMKTNKILFQKANITKKAIVIIIMMIMIIIVTESITQDITPLLDLALVLILIMIRFIHLIGGIGTAAILPYGRGIHGTEVIIIGITMTPGIMITLMFTIQVFTVIGMNIHDYVIRGVVEIL